MSIKLEDFRLMAYKEREVLMQALMIYETYRSELIEDMGHKEHINNLTVRLSATQCQPGGCEYCGGHDMESDYNG